MKRINKFISFQLVMLLTFCLSILSGHAQTYTDPSTITSTATTAFNATTVLVVSMVLFFIIVRIVKGIRR